MAEKIHFSQSLADRLYVAEFDDALLDLAGWKNPRWEGSKLKGLKINEYNGPQITGSGGIGSATIGSQGFGIGVWVDDDYTGDMTYGLNPVINNETTAIYIANSVIGGTEDKQFARIENHSYVGIEKILIVNTDDNTVQIIDRETEPFESFNRFMTSDFPTGGKLNVKILDPSIQSNLKGNYHCKMNKGWLLSTFKYFDYLNINSTPANARTWNNPIELFDNSEMGNTGNGIIDALLGLNVNRLAFKFGNKVDAYPTITNGITNGSSAIIADFSPNYTNAIITPNKFTQQYYSGSFTFPSKNTGFDGAFFSASRFILNDTVQFLNDNFEDTEIHLTINKGTKDFAPDWNDERSIGTFELDRGYGASSAINKNDHTDGGGSTNPNPEKFMGHNTPFYPIMQLKGGFPYTPTTFPQIGNLSNQGVMLQVGGGDYFAQLTHTRDTYFNGNENPLKPYSGSISFELSFLDKDHTLILDIDKEKELFEGIGEKGVALIPEYLHGTIKKNLAYYLKKAGIIDKAPNTQS
tara:strand:+ start:9146 stop:10714 length:1569 start_codon:yes stop_codon:yes gene_type:complete